MTMNDWDNSLDEFLQFRRREILEGKGKPQLKIKFKNNPDR
ncbi:hypothetical protein CIW83_05725 [Tissierella sp. P1]|nr:hypothetical protein CIW83_05725 [Tissierella sp. P1]